MIKIIIQNQACETVINNVQPEDLDFWRELLNGALQRGQVQIIDLSSGRHQAA
jgi:hypothetical protein